MCISNNQYDTPRVEFTDTVLFGAVVRNPQNEIEHILGYSNKVAAKTFTNRDFGHNIPAGDIGWTVNGASSSDDFGYDIAPPPRRIGNAMLFCVPARPGSLTAQSLIPVSKYPHFMEDLRAAILPSENYAKSFTLSITREPAKAIVVKGFDDGTYDVVIAPGGPSQIASVIAHVDDDKRPDLNEKLYAELSIVYPGFAAVLFCFAEDSAEKAGCALMRYQPMQGLEHLMFLPGLDGHNGHIERGMVTLNHTIVLGHYDMKVAAGEPVTYTDAALHANRPYWAVNRVVGSAFEPNTVVPQGDFWARVDDVRNGNLRLRRQVPPGWSKLPDKPADPATSPFYITSSRRGYGVK